MEVNRPSLLRGTLFAALLLAAGLILPGIAQAGLVKLDSWGGGIAKAKFQLRAVAYDSQDRAYVAETGKSRVVRIETDGSINPGWKVGDPSGNTGNVNPVDLAVGPDDSVYVLDQIDQKVVRYSEDGVVLDIWNAGVPPGDRVQSIAFASGSVWVIGESDVRRYSPNGTYLGIWGGFESSPDWVRPLIRGDGSGNLLVTAAVLTGEFTATKSVYRFQPDGDLISKWTTAAETERIDLTDGYDEWQELSAVYGFDAIAPAPGGLVWASVKGKIRKFGAAGPTGVSADYFQNARPNSLTVDSSGEILFSWVNREGASGVKKLDGDLEETGNWVENNFPKYPNTAWDGLFRNAGSLAVRSDGVVGGYDSGLSRAQLFSSEGAFQKRIEGPQPDYADSERISLVLPETGGVEFFEELSEKLSRYSEAGELQQEIELNVPGEARDIVEDPGAGYVTVSSENLFRGRISFFDEDGVALGGFDTDSPLETDLHTGSKLEIGPDGSIYLLTPFYLEKYSRSGELLASWKQPEGCVRSHLLMDVTTFGDGVFVLSYGPTPDLLKFDSSLRHLWEEPTGEPQSGWIFDGWLDAGPDGSIYIDSGHGIGRFDVSAASAPPAESNCPVPKPTVTLRAISYDRKYRWAKMTVQVSRAGRLTINGTKVISRNRVARKPGRYTFLIKPKKSSANKVAKRRKFPIKVTYRSGNFKKNLRMNLWLVPPAKRGVR